MTRRRSIRILIAESIPSLNKGEMALLEGMLESFRRLDGEVSAAMLSDFPEIDGPRYEGLVEVVEHWPHRKGLRGTLVARVLSSVLIAVQHVVFVALFRLAGDRVLRLFSAGIWREYLRADVIIQGHDSAFGLGGKSAIPYFYNMYGSIVARFLGKPVVFYVGDLREVLTPWKLRFFKPALKNMDLILFRDRSSFARFEALSLDHANVHVTADLAFLLKPAIPERIAAIVELEGINNEGRPLIGMTVRRDRASMAFPELKTARERYDRHIDVMVRVVDEIVSCLGATVWFLPHCIGQGAEPLDDRVVAKDVISKCRNRQRVRSITSEYSASELKGLIAHFDMVIGERVHSVIAALSSGVPGIIISNSDDQRLEIFRAMGQGSAVLGIENLDSEKLVSKALDVWSKRDQIRAELLPQAEAMRRIAWSNGDRLREVVR